MAETNTGGVTEKAGNLFTGALGTVAKHPFLVLGGLGLAVGSFLHEKGKWLLMGLAAAFMLPKLFPSFFDKYAGEGAAVKTADTPKTETPVADKNEGVEKYENLIKENMDKPLAPVEVQKADEVTPQPQVTANQPDTTKQVNH